MGRSDPAHTGPVFDAALPIVGEGFTPAAPVEAGVVGGHTTADAGVQLLLQGSEFLWLPPQEVRRGVQPQA